MTKHLLSILLFIFFAGFALAQSNSPKKFSFSISAGPAFPVGVFAKKDMESAVIYFPDSSISNMASISKSNNGFAQVGFSFHGALNYKFSNHFYTFIRAGISSNSISVAEMNDFVNKLYGVGYSFSHVNNNLFTITPGLGYTLQKAKWEYRTGIFLGYGQINYPYYEVVREVGNERLKWAHSGPRPNLRALTSGGTLQVSRAIGKLNIGLEMLFQQANFEYSIFPKTSPGGSQSETYDDRIKARILTLGLLFSYNFSSPKK